jgi:hypothetical protein
MPLSTRGAAARLAIGSSMCSQANVPVCGAENPILISGSTEFSTLSLRRHDQLPGGLAKRNSPCAQNETAGYAGACHRAALCADPLG